MPPPTLPSLSSLTKIGLCIVCALCWLMQSLPALFLYMDGADISKRRSVPAEHLALPHLLFCNRFPFTQAGLASLGAQFNSDSVLAYLRQWLDPSVGVGLPDDAMASVGQLSADDRATAEATIAQLLPNGRLKQRLEQLMPQCQDMVSSCVLRGHQLSGFDCCRMVQPWLATPRAGICWPFVANASTSVQSPLDNALGIQITFQISRNSFHSGALSVHPGLSVHLVPADLNSRLRMSTSIESSSHANAHSLSDKHSLRLDIRKEIVVADHSSVCFDGTAGGAADTVPKGVHQSVMGTGGANAAAGLLCMLEKAVEHCACVPMIVVLWTLQGDLDSNFLRRFNASTICTVGEFEHCAHPFVEFAMAPAWDFYPTPSEAGPELRAAVDACRKAYPRVCRHEKFPAHSQERDLPPEYQNTQDFVSRLSVSFDSFLVTELSTVREMDIYKLLSTLGYNLWWFAIGHLLWTLCRFRCCHLSSSVVSLASSGGKTAGNNKVSPKSAPMVPPAIAETAGAAPAANSATTTTSSTRTMANNGTSANSPKQNSNSSNCNNTALSVQHAPPPLSPPRALPRAGARQLPPLTIGGGGASGGRGGHNNDTLLLMGGGGAPTIVEDDGPNSREGHNNPSFIGGDDEPPQRRRHGPKLALDEQ